MRKLLIVAAVLGLAGCATGYQPRGYVGGYTDVRTREDTFIISFRSNIFTRQDVVEQYTMLRASELCLGAGYPYFDVLGAQGEDKPAVVQQAVAVSGSGSVNVSSGSGKGLFSTIGASMMVRCLKEKPDGDYIDAKLLRDHVRQTYRIKG